MTVTTPEMFSGMEILDRLGDVYNNKTVKGDDESVWTAQVPPDNEKFMGFPFTLEYELGAKVELKNCRAMFTSEAKDKNSRTSYLVTRDGSLLRAHVKKNGEGWDAPKNWVLLAPSNNIALSDGSQNVWAMMDHKEVRNFADLTKHTWVEIEKFMNILDKMTGRS